MEIYGQRSYSILTKTEVYEKMMEQVTQISEFFTLSKSDALVVLMHLRWNLDQASDYLSDKKDKLMLELGLVSSKTDESKCLDTKGDDDGDLVSKTWWRDYLIESLENSKVKGALIACLDQNCLASVGPDTIEKLPEPVKEMYENYVLGSFMEGNKDSIKWCPQEGCVYAILKLNEDAEESSGFGVVCLCGHMFCWRCQLESHRPVSCANASLWSNRFLDQARSLAWIARNTKLCPNCNSPVRKEDDSEIRLIQCICSYTFCWVCLRQEEAHNGRWNCANRAIVIPPLNQERANYEDTQIRHMDIWDSEHQALEKAKEDLKILEQHQIAILTESCGLGEQEIKALKEAWILIVQCKQVLKWSSVYEYFVPEDQVVKRNYVIYRRENADKTLENHKVSLQELIEEANSAGASYFLAHKVETLTATTRSYFHEYVKNLEVQG